MKASKSKSTLKDSNKVSILKSKVKIPANIDPIKLADEIKGDLTAEFLKRMKKLEPKSPLVLQSG